MRGFRAHTLLEMMVVVVILAVMAGASVPRLRWLAMSSGFENDVARVTNFFLQAQKRALLEHKQWIVKIDPVQRSFLLYSAGEGGDDSPNVLSGGALKAFKIGDDVQMESSIDQIGFYPDGYISSARVRLSKNGHSVILSSNEEWGRISLLTGANVDGHD